MGDSRSFLMSDSDSETRSHSSLASTSTVGKPPRRVLIIGAGIAGLASALSISKELTPFVPDVQITVFERHDVLSTSGGAINLTPVAQRHLDYLGVLAELDKMGSYGGADVDAIELFSNGTGRSLGSIDFTDSLGNGYGGYKGRRVMRIILSVAMMAVLKRLKNVDVVFGKKLVTGTEAEDHATVHFEDGTTAEGDLVVGCDGVQSATRTLWVDPNAVAQYTGLSFVQTTMCATELTTKPHFRGTAMNISRHGSLLASYCDRDKEQLFLAAIVEFDERALDVHRESHEQDWRTRHGMRQRLAETMHHRFGHSAISCVRAMISQASDWILYPVYQVQPGRRWHNDRVLLLGDAAHAVRAPIPWVWLGAQLTYLQMPPRDESAAYALDDAILLARVLARLRNHPPSEIFQAYEETRRRTVNSAYEVSNRMWNQHRDMGTVHGWWKERKLPRSIRKQKDGREAAWEFDARDIDIPLSSDQLFSAYSGDSS